MTFQMNIEEIINNDNFSISEKLAKLSDLGEKYRQKIEQVKKEITTDYRYCPKCKDYYPIPPNATRVPLRSPTKAWK